MYNRLFYPMLFSVVIALLLLTFGLFCGKPGANFMELVGVPKAVETEATPIQAAIVSMTNTYKEIGWRDVLSVDTDPESHCAFVIVSMNNMTNETKTLVKCWVDRAAVPGIMRYRNGIRQAYILKVERMFGAFPSLVVKWDARTTRADK